MNCATKSRWMQLLVWLLWVLTCLVFLGAAGPGGASALPLDDDLALPGVVLHDAHQGAVFPWQPRARLRKWAWRRYCAWRRAYRRAVWTARLARLALRGALTLAQVVDLLAQTQLRRQMGALPVLYALLDVLQVRATINRYCPTAAQLDHGLVALVLILNRLLAPRPLYQVADWLAQTVLVYQLGLPAAKFNDDRLARTLDALQPHVADIWQEIVQRAFVQAQIDLSLLFYDLSAFVAHGAYRDSDYVDFGFAHNTPMNKRKFKAGLDATGDGGLPAAYGLWRGRTADLATVAANMDRLRQLLQRHGWPVGEVLVVGDRANLNDELALAYEDHDLRYLAGLQPHKKVHQQLLLAQPERHFYAHALTPERGPRGYWGLPCPVRFKHDGREVTHHGLVVLSGPMRTALRRTRATKLRTARQALRQVQAQIGQPRCRTVKAVQRRANKQLKDAGVSKLLHAQAYSDAQGQVGLHWRVDREALAQAMQRDGRYLLVTNDAALSPERMLALYRQKDAVEKRFQVTKSDLRISPIYLHKDARIEAMLLINMLALLAYSLLERQVRQNGWQLTTRRLIALLESLDVVETRCWDGSCLYRLVPVTPEQAALLECLAQLLTDLRLPHWPHVQLAPPQTLTLALPPPASDPPAR